MQATLKKLKHQLVPIYGAGETNAIIKIIFHHLKGWNLTDMLIHSQDELSPFIKSEIDKILSKLLRNEPIQYITGEARFHGMNMKVAPGVLIPRQETDELVDIIITENENKSDLKVLDICTGSGCIAIALARNLKFADVSAVDISKTALEIAQENAKELKANVNFIEADIFEWDHFSKYDIVVSNPPYIMDKEALKMEKNVLDFEPHEALFVRDDAPLVFYDKIADISMESLNSNGKLYLEINPLTADELYRLIESKGFSDINLLRDSYGKIRFLTCKKF